jgi:hypothetical protein
LVLARSAFETVQDGSYPSQPGVNPEPNLHEPGQDVTNLNPNPVFSSIGSRSSALDLATISDYNLLAETARQQDQEDPELWASLIIARSKEVAI